MSGKTTTCRGRSVRVPVIEAPPAIWTIETLKDLVIELLAEALQEDPDALRARLLETDDAMPIDSLDLLDVLQEFRTRTGLRMPVRKLRHHTMRSVQAFAEFAVAEGSA